MEIEGRHEAQGILSEILCGMYLDSIHVHSIAMNLGFLRTLERQGPKNPSEIWISIMSTVRVVDSTAPIEEAVRAGDESSFFSLREEALRDIYRLLGKEISSVQVERRGELILSVQGKNIVITRDEAEFEEIWSVMDRTPDVSQDHELHITLADENRIVSKTRRGHQVFG